MSDEVLTIKLTEREIDLLHQCISTNIETVKRRHPMTGSAADLIQELGELSDDLLEQKDRADDPVDFAAKHDREGKVFMVAEDDFIQRGIDAREKAKANSRAATRRSLNLKDKDRKLSAQQQHDVWDANDPRNW
jgi:hypothetical protein